jgi:hypothetical protein
VFDFPDIGVLCRQMRPVGVGNAHWPRFQRLEFPISSDKYHASQWQLLCQLLETPRPPLCSDGWEYCFLEFGFVSFISACFDAEKVITEN